MTPTAPLWSTLTSPSLTEGIRVSHLDDKTARACQAMHAMDSFVQAHFRSRHAFVPTQPPLMQLSTKTFPPYRHAALGHNTIEQTLSLPEFQAFEIIRMITIGNDTGNRYIMVFGHPHAADWVRGGAPWDLRASSDRGVQLFAAIISLVQTGSYAPFLTHAITISNIFPVHIPKLPLLLLQLLQQLDRRASSHVASFHTRQQPAAVGTSSANTNRFACKYRPDSGEEATLTQLSAGGTLTADQAMSVFYLKAQPMSSKVTFTGGLYDTDYPGKAFLLREASNRNGLSVDLALANTESSFAVLLTLTNSGTHRISSGFSPCFALSRHTMSGSSPSFPDRSLTAAQNAVMPLAVLQTIHQFSQGAVPARANPNPYAHYLKQLTNNSATKVPDAVGAALRRIIPAITSIIANPSEPKVIPRAHTAPRMSEQQTLTDDAISDMLQGLGLFADNPPPTPKRKRQVPISPLPLVMCMDSFPQTPIKRTPPMHGVPQTTCLAQQPCSFNNHSGAHQHFDNPPYCCNLSYVPLPQYFPTANTSAHPSELQNLATPPQCRLTCGRKRKTLLQLLPWQQKLRWLPPKQQLTLTPLPKPQLQLRLLRLLPLSLPHWLRPRPLLWPRLPLPRPHQQGQAPLTTWIPNRICNSTMLHVVSHRGLTTCIDDIKTLPRLLVMNVPDAVVIFATNHRPSVPHGLFFLLRPTISVPPRHNTVALLSTLMMLMLKLTWVAHATARTMLLALTLVTLHPSTCHRGARPQRAQFLKRFLRCTTPCTRYVTRPAWWKYCNHKHSMWTMNPFVVKHGTLVARYRLRVLAHATLFRTCNRVPGATLTQHRWLPMMYVHMRRHAHSERGRPPRIHAHEASPNVTLPPKLLTNFRPIHHNRCAVQTGGGPKHDTRQRNRANRTASNRSHPHVDRVTRRVSGSTALADLAMYCEPQRDMQCGVHALNAMAGRKIADGPAVSSMLYDYWPEGRSDNRPSYGRGGNYSVTAINVWLWAHARSPVTLINFFNNQAEGSEPLSMEGLVAQAPPGCDRIFMWFQKNGYINHYKCIRRHLDTNMWFELDSMDAGFTRQLPGTTYA
jgi:hypothetical protein